MKRRSEHTLIVGAGALGAMYAARLDAAGMPVAFLAEGCRAERLRRDGVVVNGNSLRISVVTPEDSVGEGVPDYVLVALKHHQLPGALSSIRARVGANTIVFSVMNGIDSEQLLVDALGEPTDTGGVVYAMVAGMDAVRDGAMVHYTRLGTVWIGERHNDPAQPGPRVQRLMDHLSSAGIPTEVPEDMEYMLWNKFMLNVGINQWSAVLGAPYGVFHRQEDARSLVRATMQEVVAVAHAAGVDLSETDVEHWFQVIGTLGPDGETSMLQDVTAGRKTEVEMFAGKVIELGRRWSIPTPLNDALLPAIRAIEAEGLRRRK